MPDFGQLIRLFVSSTFADFAIERDVLQRRVFPHLRQLCAGRGFRFQPIDLRWGISEAAGNERQTLRICFDELDRCGVLSPDCFMLILLGERYGSCLLPPMIPAAVVLALLPYLLSEERTSFEAMYRLDENALPAEYTLLGADEVATAEDEPLRQALARAAKAAGLSENERLPFEGSATHREIQRGLLGQPADAKRDAGVLCALRSFASPLTEAAAMEFAEEDTERAQRVRQLRTAVAARVPKDQVLHYTVPWASTQPTFDHDTLAEQYYLLLSRKLEAVMTARTVARMAVARSDFDEDTIANEAFEAQRAEHMVGRVDELKRILSYLSGDTPLPFVVTGPAGSGKSTLLARIARYLSAAQPDAVLVTRYLGVTPHTGSLVEFLNDLRQSIGRAYGQRDLAQIDDLEQLISAVTSQLAVQAAPPEHPLLLVVDALDQLGSQLQRTDWLPPRLAPYVRLVVSVIEDRPELGLLRAQLPKEQILTLAPLSMDAGRVMLHNLLAEPPRRTLTPVQEQAVLEAFSAEGLPLYLQLAAAEARRWRSFDLPKIGATSLPATTAELLEAILARLEAPTWLGRVLVGHALGDLAAARFGLAEDELLDIMARDDKVREALQALSPYSPQIDAHLSLPVALWARLYAHVEPLLTEREADGVRLYTFFHRQLRAVVEERYLSGRARFERHQALVNYFANQPWQLGPTEWNWRKVRELVVQQEAIGNREGAEQVLSGLANHIEQLSESQADLADIPILVAALKGQLITGSYWSVGQRLFALQRAAYRALGNRFGEGRAVTNLGVVAILLFQMNDARHWCDEALAIAREVGDRGTEGRILINLASLITMTRIKGGQEEAEQCLEQALAIEREVGDRTMEGMALNRLGWNCAHYGQLGRARHWYDKAQVIAREVGDRGTEGAVLANLGDLAATRGQAEVALRYYEQALALARQVGNSEGEGAILTNLGALAATRGQAEVALRYYEQALSIQQTIGDRAMGFVTLIRLARLANELGRPEVNVRYNEQALAMARQVGDRVGEWTALVELGVRADEQGRREVAQQYFEQALATAREVGDRRGEAQTLVGLGVRAFEHGQYEIAAHYYQEALASQREVGDRDGEGYTLYDLGLLEEALGHYGAAERFYQEALAIYTMLGRETDIPDAKAALARLAGARPAQD